MYIPEKLKLNRFRQVNIPRPKDYFARFGNMSTPSGRYSGDQSLISGRKTDVLSRVDAIERFHLHYESLEHLSPADDPASVAAQQEAGES